MSKLSTEVRDFVRIIATEDKTTFAVAMQGYEALQQLMKVANQKFSREYMGRSSPPAQVKADLEELKRRVLDARQVLGCHLAQAVQMFDFDAKDGPEIELKQRTLRPCREPKCKNHTFPTSYWWCERHLRDWGTDSFDEIYCEALSSGEAEAIKAGVNRMAAKVAKDEKPARRGRRKKNESF